MQKLIEELKRISEDLDVMAWCLEGGQNNDESVRSIISAYEDAPNNLQIVFEKLLCRHGDFIVKHNTNI